MAAAHAQSNGQATTVSGPPWRPAPRLVGGWPLATATRYDGAVSEKDRAETPAVEPAGPAPARREPTGVVDEPTGAGDAAARARREGGPRQNTSEPVVFRHGDQSVEGWTLNMSRGGLRAVVEIPLPVGAEVLATVGDAPVGRRARVVWAHEERGGAVLGLSFLDQLESVPPGAGSAPPPAVKPSGPPPATAASASAPAPPPKPPTAPTGR